MEFNSINAKYIIKQKIKKYKENILYAIRTNNKLYLDEIIDAIHVIKVDELIDILENSQIFERFELIVELSQSGIVEHKFPKTVCMMYMMESIAKNSDLIMFKRYTNYYIDKVNCCTSGFICECIKYKKFEILYYINETDMIINFYRSFILFLLINNRNNDRINSLNMIKIYSGIFNIKMSEINIPIIIDIFIYNKFNIIDWVIKRYEINRQKIMEYILIVKSMHENPDEYVHNSYYLLIACIWMQNKYIVTLNVEDQKKKMFEEVNKETFDALDCNYIFDI